MSDIYLSEVTQAGWHWPMVKARVLKILPDQEINGRKETLLLMGDFTGQQWCVQDREFMRGARLSVNDAVLCMFDYNPSRCPLPEVLSADPMPIDQRTVVLIPRNMAARPQDLMVLLTTIDSVGSPILRRMLHSVFSQPSIYEPFIQAPASLNHHHNEPGGLLRHSLEVAQLMGIHPGLDEPSRDLGVAAGLLHDIGKIKTLRPGKRTSTGHVVDHAVVNLEVLAPWLGRLDQIDVSLANQLRQCLTIKPQNSHYPKSLIGQLLKSADQMSVIRDRESSAFKSSPSWQKHKRVNPYESWIRC